MRVSLGADPRQDGRSGSAGVQAGYAEFVGDWDLPKRRARATLQLVLPAGARGALVEADMIAVRPKAAPGPRPEMNERGDGSAIRRRTRDRKMKTFG